jgi:hypothetical protein
MKEKKCDNLDIDELTNAVRVIKDAILQSQQRAVH